MNAVRPNLSACRCVLLRGLRKRCPQCGTGRLFRRWYTVAEACPDCRLPLRRHDADSWAAMYLSTAFITGVFVIAMLLLTPDDLLLGRVAVATAALAAIVGTLPNRKGFALAIDYLAELCFNPDTPLRIRPPR